MHTTAALTTIISVMQIAVQGRTPDDCPLRAWQPLSTYPMPIKKLCRYSVPFTKLVAVDALTTDVKSEFNFSSNFHLQGLQVS
jgi:hypothetical protein